MSCRAETASTELPPSSIPIFTTVSAFREWRRKASEDRQSVGLVPTMGALHEGHLSLVRRSLAENDLTVVSIFVNPAQFAPHEDLATYPRTLSHDLTNLAAQSVSIPVSSSDSSSHGGAASPAATRTPSAVFLPTVAEMYPSGISQNTASQIGTFVEVKGYSEQMEGKSRPTFFRGVATVVTKLFNAVEPTNAYFGQKDIQQALLLRRLTSDLLLSHPDPAHLHIIPTARDARTGLALSSRNAYLDAAGLKIAPTLYEALCAAKRAWEHEGLPKDECVRRAVALVEERTRRAQADGSGVEIKLDYIEMNDSESFDVLDSARTLKDRAANPVILSGALWVDKTRLIDNLILGGESKILA